MARAPITNFLMSCKEQLLWNVTTQRKNLSSVFRGSWTWAETCLAAAPLDQDTSAEQIHHRTFMGDLDLHVLFMRIIQCTSVGILLDFSFTFSTIKRAKRICFPMSAYSSIRQESAETCFFLCVEVFHQPDWPERIQFSRIDKNSEMTVCTSLN